MKKQKYPTPNPEELFKQKYKKSESGCWEWTAGLDPDGYGNQRVVWPDGTIDQRAHRISWKLHKAPI